jgi:hypothetical protein
MHATSTQLKNIKQKYQTNRHHEVIIYLHRNFFLYMQIKPTFLCNSFFDFQNYTPENNELKEINRSSFIYIFVYSYTYIYTYIMQPHKSIIILLKEPIIAILKIYIMAATVLTITQPS